MDDHSSAPLADDPVIGPLVTRHGPIDLEPAAAPFRRLIRSVIRQQVSMAAADAIAERVFDTVEVSPASLAETDPAVLTGCGLSHQKATYVVAIAEAFCERSYSPASFERMDDETVIEELTSIRGVGPWTAKMFLIFCLARPDVFPVEDLGIRRAMSEHVEEDLSRAEMVDRASAWRPLRTYASLHLWRSID